MSEEDITPETPEEPPASLFHRIKFDGKKITLQWEVAGATRVPEVYALESASLPHIDLMMALAALVPDVLDICQFENNPTHQSKFAVRGVTISREGKYGVTITALKGLETTPAPLVINTPFATFDDALTDDLDKKIKALEAEARKYLDGKRAQQKLGFDDDGPIATKSEADDAPATVQEASRRLVGTVKDGIDSMTISSVHDGRVTKSVTITADDAKRIRENTRSRRKH